MTSPSGPDAARRVLALAPIRHACHACAACCHGWRVTLHDDDEAARIARHGEALGVAAPIDNGALRQADGRCVFLGDDDLCRIHARFGAAEKPRVCQLYPRLSVLAEDGLRLGADPSCSSTWRSHADGPRLDLSLPMIPHDDERPPDYAAREEELLTLMRPPGASVASLVAHLSGDTRHLPALPPAFVSHALARMRAARGLLSHPAAGRVTLGALAATRELLAAIDPTRPTGPTPPLVLSDEVSAFTLEVARRTLFLRLGEYDLTPDALVLLVLAGSVACATADPRIERFGPALSGWSRVSRLPGAWRFVFPTPAALRAFTAPG